MGLVEHAKYELERAGMFDTEEDFYGGETGKAVMELIELFAKQGHSGMSAGVVSSLFSKLSMYEILGGLDGREDEWQNPDINDDDDTYQNLRDSAVFKKGKDGKPYYIDAIVFRDQDGVTFTSGGSVFMPDGTRIGSRQYIKEFPFVPKTFYVDVIEEEVAEDDFISHIKDVSQLDEVFEYYDMFIKEE